MEEKLRQPAAPPLFVLKQTLWLSQTQIPGCPDSRSSRASRLCFWPQGPEGSCTGSSPHLPWLQWLLLGKEGAIPPLCWSKHRLCLRLRHMLHAAMNPTVSMIFPGTKWSLSLRFPLETQCSTRTWGWRTVILCLPSASTLNSNGRSQSRVVLLLKVSFLFCAETRLCRVDT